MTQLWQVYNRAKLWSQRPSDIIFLTNSYEAYCFDELVHTFGTHVEHELNSIKRGKTEKQESYDAKRQRKLLSLIGAEDQIRFATPVATK